MKKVSLIIPLYKSEEFLTKLLDSTLQQTYSNLEVILVDDGSPDRSGEIAELYARKDQRVIVIHQANKGTCEARNVGLSVATGEYLMFADGDDWLELDCVEYLVSLLEKNNADMSMTDAVFTTRDRKQNANDDIKIWTNLEAVAGIINTFIIPVGPWNKLYKMKIVRDNNISFSVAWFGEGLYFSAMVAQASPKVVVGHRKVYNYRLNNPNSGCTKREVNNGVNAIKNIFYIKNQISLRSSQIDEAFDWHIWSNYYNLLLYIISANEIENYKKEYKDAKKGLREYSFKCMRHKKLGILDKIKILFKTIAPEPIIRKSIRKMDQAFINDIMK